jgi:pimeloyl-ACP methyl ester carboxylesterase
MYYELHGEGAPLVLLHGACMTIDMLGPILPGLARFGQVIAVELQGHGHTGDIDRPTDAVRRLVATFRAARVRTPRSRRVAAGDHSPFLDAPTADTR